MKSRYVLLTSLALTVLFLPAPSAPAQTQEKDIVGQLELLQLQLQSELEQLKVISSDGHPNVQKLRERLTAVEAKLEKLKPVLTAFHLKYSRADDVSDVIKVLIAEKADVRLAADKRTNRLIVQGPQEVVSTVTEAIEQLDVEQPRKDHVGAFHVGEKASVRRALNELNALTLKSVYYRNGELIVTADSKELLNRAEEIIKADLTSRPDPHMIRVVWLASNQSEPKPTPDDIQPVLVELKKHGVTDMSIAAQASIRTLGEFEASCVTTSGENLSMFGTHEAGTLEISLRVTSGEERILSVRTQIDAPLGHPVVLGLSPMPKGNSAFVVMVEKAN